MIHVVTVHWRSEEWIDPQLAFLSRNLVGEWRTWAALNDVSSERFAQFDFAEDLQGTHPEKLNRLAEIVATEADDSDLLLFLDGDAFPIAPVDSSILGGTPLAAVRRDENLGDMQPHPCFCLTTVGFWKEIGGDWRPGYVWINSLGQRVTDTGANLLETLERDAVPWRPLLRTNTRDLHPLWFAIYGDVAYHHGAGFRERVERIDQSRKSLSSQVAARTLRSPEWLPLAQRAERSFKYRAAGRRRRRFLAGNVEGEALAAEVFQSILDDPEFYRVFTDADPMAASHP